MPRIRPIDLRTAPRSLSPVSMDHPKRTAAFVWDFDGALAKGSVPEHSFLPRYGVDPGEFWPAVHAEA